MTLTLTTLQCHHGKKSAKVTVDGLQRQKNEGNPPIILLASCGVGPPNCFKNLCVVKENASFSRAPVSQSSGIIFDLQG